ncbi:hypothetical protein [Candidatus Spongiisocius sp.]|uniref:hypothetical protein n=1 Tax=Candidatus Spongiisocius sp. TaxID=3101273 RepID=UPI003B5BCD00
MADDALRRSPADNTANVVRAELGVASADSSSATADIGSHHMTVPQYRDGECEVRRLWDSAVCSALGWDPEPITQLRLLLHEEPHVKSLGYGQYADAPDDI